MVKRTNVNRATSAARLEKCTEIPPRWFDELGGLDGLSANNIVCVLIPAGRYFPTRDASESAKVPTADADHPRRRRQRFVPRAGCAVVRGGGVRAGDRRLR